MSNDGQTDENVNRLLSGALALILTGHMPYLRAAGRRPDGEDPLHEMIAFSIIPTLTSCMICTNVACVLMCRWRIRRYCSNNWRILLCRNILSSGWNGGWRAARRRCGAGSVNGNGIRRIWRVFTSTGGRAFFAVLSGAMGVMWSRRCASCVRMERSNRWEGLQRMRICRCYRARRQCVHSSMSEP